jgi:hypothetical protein
MKTRAECIKAAAAVMAAARAERDQLFADMGGGWEGALAVGRAAYRPGGPSVESIASTYEPWAEEERQKRAAGSAA